MTVLNTVSTVGDVEERAIRAIGAAQENGEPFRHWLLSNVFSDDTVTALLELPFTAPLIERSGTREVNNHSRQYFDPVTISTAPIMSQVAHAFQSRRTVDQVERTFGVSLAGSLIRIEYAMDTDGFWLEPHTDVGAKRFTMLTYISREPETHHGTDLYFSKDRHCKAVRFESNTALVFIPSSSTWHGLEPHPIVGVRKSIIINYVNSEWRSRDQLAFPEQPVY